MNTAETNHSAVVLAPLIKTINQIATFYTTLPRPEEAKQMMLKHLIATWDPSMFEPLLNNLEALKQEQEREQEQYGRLSLFAAEVLELYRSESFLEINKRPAH